MRSQLNQIQLLRGIAAFSILFAHTPYIQKGHFGVDLFFIISGFIMTYVTEKSFDNFLLKRVIRIVPLYWLGTIGLYAIALIFPDLLNTATDSVSDLLRSLFFVPYFNGRTVEPLLRLGWTLNYEMFFYLLFFLACLISHAHRAAVASFMIFMLVLFGMLVESDNLFVSFYTSPIILEFTYGMGAYYVYKAASARVDAQQKVGAKIAFLLGVSLYVALFFVQPADGYANRSVVWGLPCLLIFLLVALGGRKLKIFGGFVILGNVSYSLYLLHPYVIHLVDRKIYSIGSAGGTAYLVTLAAYAACVVIAYLSWLLIEKPSQQYLSSKISVFTRTP